MRVRHRRAIAIGLGVTLTLGIAGYAAAGLAVLQIGLAESGGDRHVEHAAFTPARFNTDVWVSDDFSTNGFDVEQYLMPDFSEVAFPSRGEPTIMIHAWWVPGPRPDGPALVAVHGAGSCRRDPALLVPAGMLHHQGFGVLLIDMRDNGDSTREDGRCSDLNGSMSESNALGRYRRRPPASC